MQSKINLFFLFFLIFFYSCTMQNKEFVTSVIEKKNIIIEKKNKIIDKKNIVINNNNISTEIQNIFPIYHIGDPYFINGIKYTPKEDYKYVEYGLASFYDKELHGVKTVNNEMNKVTDLLARHKTLPLPSVVKITNLKNGYYIIARVNDRGPINNSNIIEVSRKIAQLLRFYKSGNSLVKVEILNDESKQLKIVTQSMSNPKFEDTIEAAPIANINITDLGETNNEELVSIKDFEQPVEIGLENINKSSLYYIQIKNLKTKQEVKKINEFVILDDYKIDIQKNIDQYSVFIGPLQNADVDKLFNSLINKNYKNIEIILK